jgi:hypothetical protein
MRELIGLDSEAHWVRVLRSGSGSLAMLAAMRRPLLRVNSIAG